MTRFSWGNRRTVFVGLLALSYFCADVSGQVLTITDSTSTPIPGAGHDYIHLLSETVNPANGSVSVRLNVPTPPGRQLSLPFSFAYDSNGVNLTTGNAGIGSWYANIDFLSSGGWAYSAPLMSWDEQPFGINNCLYFADYLLQDPAGGRNVLGLYEEFYDGKTGCVNYQTPPTTLGSGYSAALGTSGNPILVTDAFGRVYHFTVSSAHTILNQEISLPDYIEDSNGNQIKVTDLGTPLGAFTVSDTLGRTLLSSSGFGSTGNTLSVAGLANSYMVTWGTASKNFTTTWTLLQQPLHFCTPGSPASGSYPAVTAISLPNEKQYGFLYDPAYGTLSKITYPGGGYVRYQWGLDPQAAYIAFPDNGGQPNGCQYRYDKPAIAHRYVSFDGTNEVLRQDFSYSTTWSTQNNALWTSKQTAVTTHDLVKGVVFQTVYTYTPFGPSLPYFEFSPGGDTAIPLEQSIVYKDVNGTTLRTVNKTWYDQYTLKSEQTKLDNGLTSQVMYTYNSGGQVTEKDEYDFGQTAPSRKTVTNYQTFGNPVIYPSGTYMFGKPCQTIIYDVNGRVAETDYLYDGGTTVCGAAGTSSVAGVGGLVSGSHDETNYGPSSTAPRGNITTKTQKCFPLPPSTQTCSDAVTTYTYDETGQVLSVKDPNLNTTQYSYTDSYSIGTPPGNTNAYLTTITRPTANGVTTHDYFKYSYADGQLTFSQDDNQKAAGSTVGTSYIYNDSLDRLRETDYPDGGKTTISYNDNAPSPSVTAVKLIDANGTNMSTTAVMDGVGHVTQTQLTTDPDGPDYTDTAFDGLGRTLTVSNPHRSTSLPTDGTTKHTYDALGRVTQVAESDGSVVNTSYVGNCTTVTDEASNARKSCSDGLGRLTGLWEDPNGLNYETDYQYNALNGLIQVVQKGSNSANARTRTFQYDSLSRLTSATNPEAGTFTYTYDSNSNLKTKVAPKPNQTGTMKVTTNYSYDALNRLTQKSYVNLSTTTVRYAYDGGTLTGCGQTPPVITSPSNLLGRRSAMCGKSSGSSWSFDLMGRPLIEARSNGGHTKNVSYYYNLDGSIFLLTYPSAHQIEYGYSGAGRPVAVWDNNVNSNNYVNVLTYAPHGALLSYISGAVPDGFIGITGANTYNKRLQPVTLSASTTAATIQSLSYDFHLGSGDNGNVQQIVNNLDSTQSVAFLYDSLNRVSQANTTTKTGPNCWGEAYTIDAWGNLTNRAGVTGMTGCSYEPLNGAPASIKNQLTGLSYDAAGNLTNDGNGNTPTYDAENRIVTDAGATYDYDADGLRMKKSTGTMYWFGPSGEVLTETDLSGNINEEYVYFNGQRIARVDRPSGTVHYYFPDHLGSASVITDASGNVEEQYYYYPFGGLVSSTGTGANHYKFTGKERDAESGLDYFGRRHYASTMGRWMTPDPLNLTSARLVNPTNTLNKYVHGANNPLKYIDRDGEDITVFYRPPSGASGDYGHILMGVLNQQTGQTGFLDYYPKNGADSLGRGAGAFNTGNMQTRADEVAAGKYATLTIQTSPDQAQEILNKISTMTNGSAPNYSVLTNNCTTVCEDVLHDLGLDFGDIMPSSYWADVYRRYSQDASNNPFKAFLPSSLVPQQTGRDYGFPRYGLNYSQFLFQLYWNQWNQQNNQQQKPQQKACVTAGGETTCEE